MIVNPLKKPNLLVIGDLMIDQYLWGKSNRISPEAPVPIIDIKEENNVLGGAGNVINNLRALGAKVDVISVIGDCDTSKEIRQLFKGINVETKYLVTQRDRISSKKSRIISSKQQVVRFDQENSEEISEESQRDILDKFKKIINEYEIILLSDYGKGVLTYNLTQSLIKIAKQFRKKVLVDPKGTDYSKYYGAYLLTPNKKEATAATKILINDDESLKQSIKKLKNDCDLSVSLITLSEKGIAIYDDKLDIQPTKAKEVYDVTGAGDTVIASLGFAIACGYDINKAVKFANLAAGVVVGKIGSATTSLDEIIEYNSSIENLSPNHNIKSHADAGKLGKKLRAKGKKIVFSNGCFDILHIGHIKYLEEARNFGDVLIVGLNSDSSVKRLKGDNRPINSQIDRALVLLSLKTVDYVIIFEENTPYKLIEAIRPHILVKGGDYKNKEVIGEDLVDELKIVNYLKDKSTTQTIKKIMENK